MIQDEVFLTGVLDEFRAALRMEIDAARRHESTSAVSLINGRRIAQVGSNYQYVFDIENVLNLPGDAPGDLYVPGHPPFDVIIISIDGMAITISVPQNLGKFVPSARLQSNLAHLMRKLIERIEALANTPNPVGERVRGALPVSGEPMRVDSEKELNADQAEAVASSLGRDTTFIWGPPGTGKTQAIGAIGEQLYQRGRSVLVVSHTNIAVDQAILRIGEKISSDDRAKGRVLRVGEPKDLKLKDHHPDLLLDTHVARRSQELAKQRDTLKEELAAEMANAIKISRKIDILEWVDEAKADIITMDQELKEVEELEHELARARKEHSRLSDLSSKWATAVRAAKYTQSRVEKIEKLNKVIKDIKRRITAINSRLEILGERLAEAKTLYEETASVGWFIRRWRRLPAPEEQLEIVKRLESEMGNNGLKLDEAKRSLVEAEKKRSMYINEVEAFKSKHSVTPEEVLRRANIYQEKFANLALKIQLLAKTCNQRRLELEGLLQERLAVLRELQLTFSPSGSAESMLSAIKSAYDTAVSQVAGLELAMLKEEHNQINGHIPILESEIQRIEDSLKKVEELVIADATIVATTLTRAYLRDSIQSRRFDTVILDEASMAPIPALWVAASLAHANAVVVGDPKQLPPIVISQNKLPKRWLGQDIFEEVGLTSYFARKPYLSLLKTQYRMHPDISAIPSALIYERFLTDGMIRLDGKLYPLSDGKCDENLLRWYRQDWGYDCPILLVNTASVDAWVTSVSRGARASRLNFLSATICVDLAEQLLRNDRPNFSPGEPPRILIICPYRPHAQLLELLIREQKLEEVRAGTAHSFQGSEADVVILDLVNDEPHWRVGMFDPKNDENTRRLINVALTRAKRRLIIVGDFDYISKLSKKAFLGIGLIPFLKAHYVSVDALDIVPTGLAARAAKAQATVLGGDVEPSDSRLVVTQEQFYPMLLGDLTRAKKRVIIFSAFITTERLGQLEASIRAAIERGVRVYVITKARGDRVKRELSTYPMLEETLGKWGVVVVHKRHMHEKLVFIDEAILWMGSLNPLSFSNTQEIMERRKNRKVVDDFIQTLRLNELLGEHEEGQPLCPICGSELVASEGTNEPFYWRCVEENCYSRSIDQPPIEGGIITCANCGSKVEYGEWGGKPHWRCCENRQHRQKIPRTHLLLPKMRAIVPKRELDKLDKFFGISVPMSHSKPPFQRKLFDLNGS